MNFEIKKQLRDTAGHAYGLLNVLKCDIDILRKDAAECNRDKLWESIRETDSTLQKLILVVGELSYIIKQYEIKGP